MTAVHLGLQRPDRPRRVVAEAEARVIEHELGRRLGDVIVDFRLDGNPLPPWQPVVSAEWPSAVDAVIDAGRLWSPELAPLTCLFARTVDGDAAEVRRRMLRHLDVLPGGPFDLDAARLDELEAWHVTPTDLWLVASAANSVDSADHSVDALASADGDALAALDAAFDSVGADVSAAIAGAVEDSLQRVIVEREVARRHTNDATDQLARTNAEIADRLDALDAENAVLRERLERIEMQRQLDRRDP